MPEAPVATIPTAPASPVPGAPAPAEASAQGGGTTLWWWLIAALVVAGGAGAVLLRRRRSFADEPVWEPEEADAAAEPEPVIPAVPVAAPAARPTPPPAPVGLDVELEPVRFSVSLVNATLQYRLRLTNRSAQAIGPVAVAADMIGAHASLPDDSQLARDGVGLELRHEVPAIGPGETAELRGELRLPLASVTPIVSGSATLMVPLVRLRLEAPGLAFTRAIVVGESPAAPGGLLRPFRLDTGPRTFASVGQRGVAEAA
jgi:hypothetical protein